LGCLRDCMARWWDDGSYSSCCITRHVTASDTLSTFNPSLSCALTWRLVKLIRFVLISLRFISQARAIVTGSKSVGCTLWLCNERKVSFDPWVFNERMFRGGAREAVTASTTAESWQPWRRPVNFASSAVEVEVGSPRATGRQHPDSKELHYWLLIRHVLSRKENTCPISNVDAYAHTRSGSALVSINEVNLHRSRLVLIL